MDCPDCGADAEWLEIIGDDARPLGSIYRCPDCGTEFNDLPDGPTWKYAGGRL